MSDQRAMVRALFDATAETYDQVGVDFFAPIADRLVAELGPRAGERVLDIGCGRGAVLSRFADAVGADGEAVGIDLSPNMVEATRTDLERAGTRATVLVDDAQQPAAVEGPFDVVAASLVLFFLPDPVAALGAWRALLAPGGRLGVSTFGAYSDAWHQVDAVFAPYLPPDLADPRTQGEASPFGSDEGVEGLLRAGGFDAVRTVGTTVQVRFDDVEHWHRWTWSQGQRRMWMLVPEDERPAVLEAAAERLDGTRDEQGRIGFDQVVRFTLATA